MSWISASSFSKRFLLLSCLYSAFVSAGAFVDPSVGGALLAPLEGNSSVLERDNQGMLKYNSVNTKVYFSKVYYHIYLSVSEGSLPPAASP